MRKEFTALPDPLVGQKKQVFLFLFLFFVFQVFCKTADLKIIENPRCRQKSRKIITK